MQSGLLTQPVHKLYKLNLCVEYDNLPPITRSPESPKRDDVMLGSEDEMMEDEDEETEPKVTLPQRLGEEKRLFIQAAIRTDRS